MSLTPQPVLRHRVLVVLSAYAGGSRSRKEVLEDLDEAFHAAWTEDDLAAPASAPNEVNWEVRTSFQRAALVREGLLTNDADGYWTLTPAGRQAAEEAITRSIEAQATGSMKRRLGELTDPNAVQQAIEEFLEVGREQFLEEYGLEKSRDYFVQVDDLLVDSKPLLSVAYMYQYPDRGLLPVSAFSGGSGGAVRKLAKLGFKAVTRVELDPPTLGRTFPTRTHIYEYYGGDKVAGIIRFPGDEVVNVFSDAEGPYSDDPPTLTQPFGYRGEGLNGPQRLTQRGNALLEQTRVTRARVRFWYRPIGEEFSFVTWALVVGRAWVAGAGEDGEPRPELEWKLMAVQSGLAELPDALGEELADALTTVDDDEQAPEAQATPSYEALVDRVEKRGQKPKANGLPRVDYARSAAARRAVLVRAAGKCESQRCTGMPAELNRSGVPILDVDHIQDLGLGGADHPSNMVALCPNCHACKTRGARTRRWRTELKRIARAAHEAAMASASAAD